METNRALRFVGFVSLSAGFGLLVMPLELVRTFFPTWISAIVALIDALWLGFIAVLTVRRAGLDLGIRIILSICSIGLLTLSWYFYTPDDFKQAISFAGLALTLGLTAGLALPRKTIYLALIFVACGEACLMVIQFAVHRGGVYSAGLFRPEGSIGSSTTIGALLATAATIVASVGLSGGSFDRRRGSAVLFCVLWVGLLLTFSRGPILIATISVLYLSFKRGFQLRRPASAILLSVCLLGSMVSFGLRYVGPQASDSASYAAYSRVNQWRGAGELLARTPLGVGPEGLVFDIPYRVKPHKFVILQATDPKNSYLALAASLGPAGAGAGALFIVFLLTALRRSHSVHSRTLGLSCFTLGAISLFDSPLFVRGAEPAMFGLGLISGVVACLEK